MLAKRIIPCLDVKAGRQGKKSLSWQALGWVGEMDDTAGLFKYRLQC